MSRLCGLSLAVVAVVATPALAQSDGDGYTLEQAVAAMRSAHPLVLAARASVDAALGDAIDAGLWTNPVLSGSWTQAVENSSYGHAGYTTFSIGQFVELSNAPGARRRSANAEVAASRADLDAVVALLALDLESAMIDRAAAVETVRALERIAAGLREAQRIIETRVQAGAAPPYDAARIAISVALLDSDLASARAGVFAADGRLRAAIGPGVDRLAGDPRYDLFDAPDLPSLAALALRLRSARPDLIALRDRTQSAEASISASQRAVFPGVMLQLGGGVGASPGQVDVSVGVSAPIPIVDRGQGSVAASRARATAARALESALLSPAELELGGAYAAASQRRAALDDYRSTAATTSERMIEQARAGYVAGRFSVLELADAYQSLRDAEARAIDLAQAARSAEVDVGRLIGASLRGTLSSPRKLR